MTINIVQKFLTQLEERDKTVISPELFSKFGKSFKKDDVIYIEGDWGCNLYLLIKGQVSIYKQYKGTSEFLTTINEGEIFGEMAIFENSTRSATVIANSFIQLLKIDRTNFDIIFNLHPSWTFKLLMGLSKRIYRNLKKLETTQNAIREEEKEKERIMRWKNMRNKKKNAV